MDDVVQAGGSYIPFVYCSCSSDAGVTEAGRGASKTRENRPDDERHGTDKIENVVAAMCATREPSSCPHWGLILKKTDMRKSATVAVVARLLSCKRCLSLPTSRRAVAYLFRFFFLATTKQQSSGIEQTGTGSRGMAFTFTARVTLRVPRLDRTLVYFHL